MEPSIDVATDLDTGGLLTLEPSDQDVVEAMRRIPGYLDISTEDFRALYRLAHDQALSRLLRPLCADRLMIRGVQPLRPEMRLDEAARLLAAQSRKSLPVVAEDLTVVGMLTETDFLRCLGSASFLGLLLGWVEDPAAFECRCRHLAVGGQMTTPAICLPEHADADGMLHAFQRHWGRSMPVVDAEGRLCGLLLRKDLLRACRGLRA